MLNFIKDISAFIEVIIWFLSLALFICCLYHWTILASLEWNQLDHGAWSFLFLCVHLSHSISPFLWWVFFQHRVLRTICPGWLQTVVLLISASGVAGITGVSHWCLAWAWSFKCVVELALQIFYWEFLCLCSSRSIIFFFCPCLVGAALVLVLC
jgi:hypothetical protein